MANPYLPQAACIIERIQESDSLFTLRLALCDSAQQQAYQFEPGQFNMLYLYGVGEVPISIVSDPIDEHIIDHTIRSVGRVSKGLGQLGANDVIGLRGPYGRGWPMQAAEQKDVIVITGGLGCAPTVSVINYIARRRERFGRLNIVQGVKHSADFIWQDRYARWRQLPDTKVLLAADAGAPLWPGHIGRVTDLFDELQFDAARTLVMMCGPEGMMHAVLKAMLARGLKDEDFWLSMERNMQCAIGHCGHCQYGGCFVCKDGPVFRYDEIKPLFSVGGF